MVLTGANPECHVYWAHVDTGYAFLWHLLDTTERERARRYRHAPSRARFVLGRGLARLAVTQVSGLDLEAVRFEAVCRHCGGPHGRLAVSTPDGPLHVSISHSGNRVGVALAWEVECGLDIERVALRANTVPTNALSAAERASLAQLPATDHLAAFIRTWTRKEAVLKATGDGLVLSPAALTMSSALAPARLVAWEDRPPPHTEVHLRDLEVGPDYRASLATLRRPVAVIEHEADICWLAEMSAPL